MDDSLKIELVRDLDDREPKIIGASATARLNHWLSILV